MTERFYLFYKGKPTKPPSSEFTDSSAKLRQADNEVGQLYRDLWYAAESGLLEPMDITFLHETVVVDRVIWERIE